MNVRTGRWAVAGTVLTLSALSLAAPAKTALFKSTQGYTIMPPAGMMKYPSTSPQMDVMFLNKQGASLNIIVSKVPNGTSLDASRTYARKMMAGTLSKYKALSQGSMMVGGTKALTLSSSFEAGTPPRAVRVLSVLTIRGGKAYAFSCGSPAAIYSRYDSTFKRSLGSLRWTK